MFRIRQTLHAQDQFEQNSEESRISDFQARAQDLNVESGPKALQDIAINPDLMRRRRRLRNRRRLETYG